MFDKTLLANVPLWIASNWPFKNPWSNSMGCLLENFTFARDSFPYGMDATTGISRSKGPSHCQQTLKPWVWYVGQNCVLNLGLFSCVFQFSIWLSGGLRSDTLVSIFKIVVITVWTCGLQIFLFRRNPNMKQAKCWMHWFFDGRWLG